ncbi:MAG: undecaprenyl-diphosphate phosphatase [Microscillaceae bacterium]|nr:undecaprenyl-diphosphate phosphatase [Microscillaceae bacterium]MDW8461923.1 undecaprenyl-diphosphate phosphatase [Cytophagales bacterium]
MTIWQAIILAIVEGITEFLPISSTGHMIIVSAIMNLHYNDFTKVFEINIQFGAILSVIVLYYKNFFQDIKFYLKLFVAFLPAAIAGFMLGKYIDQLLESVPVVAFSLLIGGVFLLFIDKIFNNPTKENIEIPYTKAFVIGLFQCIALIPGISRSAASIIGGMSQGLNRKQAAEFSFFLAVPTMFAASAYKLLKSYKSIDTQHVYLLLIGNAVAFIVAMLAIKFFINYLSRYGFKLFGYYRITLGLLLLILLALKVNLQVL